MLSLNAILGLGLVGGWAILDRTAFLQCGVSRPLVGAALAGVVLKAPLLGLWCGMFLELLWLTEAPMGTSLPPDDALAGVICVAVAWAAPQGWEADARAALGVVLAVPSAYLGRWLDMAVRHWNAGLTSRARKGLEIGDWRAVGRAHRLGSLRFFVSGVVAAAVLAVGGVGLTEVVLPLLPEGTERGFGLVARVLPVLGVAAVLARWSGIRQTARFACGAAVWGAGTWPGGVWPWTR